MKIKSHTLIFLEHGYKEATFIQDTLSEIDEIIIIGHAHSELKLIRMLKEFLPDILLLNAKMLSYEFLLKLYPFINNSGVKLLAYSAVYKEEERLKKIMNKLKCNISFSFFQIRPTDSREAVFENISLQLKNMTQKKSAKEKKTPSLKTTDERADRLIIIGSSAGGPRILRNILLQFPGHIPAAIIIVQHIPSLFSQTLVESLSKKTQIKLKEASEGDVLMKNQIYVAKGDHHLEIVTNNGENCLHLHKRPKVLSVRPSIDVTMFSAAKIFNKKIVAVILTGIGKDGTEGIKTIKKAGGTVIAQNQETSLIFGMPKSAIESGCVDYILPYYKIADVSVNLISQK